MKSYVTLFVLLAVIINGCGKIDDTKVYSCEKDSDCVWGIHLDRCCDCPGVYTRLQIERTDSIIEYTYGANYSSRMTIICGDMACEPCADTGGYYTRCINRECRAAEKYQQNPDDMYYCDADSDCTPLPGCHPRECINSRYEDEYPKPEVCTAMFDCSAAYSPEDCACEANKCVNMNLGDKGCTKE